MRNVPCSITVVLAALMFVGCGGASSPAAPSGGGSTGATAPVIASVTPAALTAAAAAQTLTVTGTNFQAGLMLTMTAPSGSLTVFGGAQVQSLSATSFQVSAVLASGGAYAFQVTNPNAEKSNVASVTVQAAAASWTVEGVRLTNADVGFSGAFADTTSIQLSDGRWRMFYFAGGQYRSAVSSNGLSFSVESGARLPVGAGQARAVRLDDGRVRIFYTGSSGIMSAISSDEGLTFDTDNGARVPGAFSGPTVVRKNGQWRMYFSDRSFAGSTAPVRVLSATSADMVNWSMEAGVRVGAGASITGSADHPCAVINADGTTSLYYFRASAGGVRFSLYTATSSDGLSFTSETSMRSLGLGDAGDPDVVKLGDGSQRMYYNWGDDSFGVVYSARQVAGAFVFGAPRAVSPRSPAAILPPPPARAIRGR